MGSHTLSVEAQRQMLASFKKSEQLLNQIYFKEKEFREHELQEASTAAHAARDALNAELDAFMSIRIVGAMSPPRVKLRRNPANWGGPLNFANANVGSPPNSRVSRKTNNTAGKNSVRGSTRKRRRPNSPNNLPISGTQVFEW
jgi:hypothetical protein